MKPSYLSVIIGSGIGMMLIIGLLVVLPIFTNNKVAYSDSQIGTSAENDCSKFYTIPENPDDFYINPVLLANSNSTICAKLVFKTVYNFNDTSIDTKFPRLLWSNSILRIGDYNVTSNGHSFGIAPGKDYTNSFNIREIPQTVDLAKYAIGSNFTITYIIKPLSNATGFYDYSIPRLNCWSYPLSVGYTKEEVNSSDFSKISPLGKNCEVPPYKLTSVEVSGVSYEEIQLQSIPFK